MNPNHKDKAIGYLIDRTQKRLKLSMTRRLQEIEAGVTVEQWVILDRLHQEKGLNQNELADRTFKDAPNVSRILNLLVKKGLARRVMDEEDRRRFKIELTATGKETVQRIEPAVEALRSESWQGLDDVDFQDLVRILDQIYRNLNGQSGP
jgi:DNA-binding MarR family transcriptional regulator